MPEPRRVRTVLLADDHPLVLGAIARLVQSALGLEVVATCSDGRSALDEIRRLEPDLAVVDMAMPGLTGLELLASVAREGLPTRLVLVTASMNDGDLLTAADRGAAGVMFKDWSPDDLLAGFRAVLDGRRCLPDELLEAARAREEQRQRVSPSPALPLTPREQQVVVRVAAGLSNKRIALDLDVTEGTVKVHLHKIYEKLGVRNRTELAKLSLSHSGEMGIQRKDH